MTFRRGSSSSSIVAVAWACVVACCVVQRHGGVVSGMSIPPTLADSAALFTKKRGSSPFGVASLEGGRNARVPLCMAIPGNGLGEQIFVGGLGNFLSIYNLVITGRVLLSWFPQAQQMELLQPVFAITDPYLNLFRGLLPPIFGLDLSPLLAFFALNAATTATAALGCDDLRNVPTHIQKQLQQQFGSSRTHKSTMMTNN